MTSAAHPPPASTVAVTTGAWRVLHDDFDMGVRRVDLRGYDPVVHERSARFVAFTQDVDLDQLELPRFFSASNVHPVGDLRGHGE